jgi:hypothetical protein
MTGLILDRLHELEDFEQSTFSKQWYNPYNEYGIIDGEPMSRQRTR